MRYKDFKDKSKEGINTELRNGLVKAAVFMYQTHGFPLECFNDEMAKLKNKARQLLWYMNFMNRHKRNKFLNSK